MKQFHTILTQIGLLKITFEDDRIIFIDLTDQNEPETDGTDEFSLDPAIRQAETQLMEYFQGSRTSFSLPVSLSGNHLQLSVCQYLQTVPYGTTVSYTEVANAVGCKSIRAAATAVAQNPIPILIPCHRVIRKSGRIGNYSLGGVHVKEFLLNLERINR